MLMTRDGYRIERGTILHSYGFKEIGHGKFFVIAGISRGEVAGFFFINSDINRFIRGKDEMLSMQYLMKKEDYGFLQYDSFLSAHEIVRIRIDRLENDISEGTARILGCMKAEHLEEVLRMARLSRLFKPRDRKNFLY